MLVTAGVLGAVGIATDEVTPDLAGNRDLSDLPTTFEGLTEPDIWLCGPALDLNDGPLPYQVVRAALVAARIQVTVTAHVP
jgi:hypothetical protein